MAAVITNSDQELLRLLQSDDQAAFDILYRKYWKELYNAAYKRLKNTEQSKDIIQEVFSTLWVRRHDLNIITLESYLHTAVRHQVYRHVGRSPGLATFIEPFEKMALASGADDGIMEKELAALFHTWLACLPEKRKQIFLLYYRDKLTTKEIAKQLNISQKSVQNQLGIASTDLQDHLRYCLLTWL